MSSKRIQPEASIYDDDSISITSTVPSEPREEYPVEGILAEREVNGFTEYLVRWEGYPEERCTWEPEDNFQDDGTLPDWENRRMRIKNGLALPYDVDGLEKRVQKWVKDTKVRKDRRRTKRLRLGLPVAPEESEEHESEDESIHMESPPSDRRTSPRNLNGSAESAAAESDSDSLPLSYYAKVRHQQRQSKDGSPSTLGRRATESIVDDSSTDETLMQRKQKRPPEKSEIELSERKRPPEGVSGQISKPKEDQKPTAFEIRKTVPPKATLASTSIKYTDTASMSTGAADGTKSRYLGTAGRGPARLGHKSAISGAEGERRGRGRPPFPRVDGSAIFKNWAAPMKPKKRLAELPYSASKKDLQNPTFSKLSMKRKYEKAGRNEPAPNFDQLVFVGLKNGKATGKAPHDSLKFRKTSLTEKLPLQSLLRGPSESEIDQSSSGLIGGNVESLFIEEMSPLDGADENSRPLSAGSPTSQQRADDNESYPEQAQAKEQKSIDISRAPKGPKLDLPRRGSMQSSVVGPVPNIRTDLSQDKTRRASLVSSEALAPPPRMQDDTVGRGGLFSAVLRNKPDSSDSHPRLLQPGQVKGLLSISLSEVRGDFGMEWPNKKPKGHPQDVNWYEDLNKDDKSDVYGDIFLGPDKSHLATTRFRGLENIVKRLFLTIKAPPKQMHVWFKDICTADDYRSYFHQDGTQIYYGAGHIAPWLNTIKPLERLVETLIQRDSWTRSWRFLDEAFDPDTPLAPLRFFIRTPIPELLSNITKSKEPSVLSLIMPNESSERALFRHFIGIDFEKLIHQAAKIFYVMCPSQFRAEQQILIRWLESNKAKVYTTEGENPGSWDFFVTSVPAGCVLIHDAVDPMLHQIPKFARMLRNSINVFMINLTSTPPAVPLTRLFPHGAGIYLTDSLFLLRPRDAFRILYWFRMWVQVNKIPSTWKLITRPRLKDWILSIIEERSVDEGNVYVQIYEQLYHILPLDQMEEEDLFETPKQDAPMAWSCSDEISNFDKRVGLGEQRNDMEGLARNDNRLAEWFAGWSRTKVEKIRKFHIVHGVLDGGEDIRKAWGEKWRYMMALTVEEFYRVHGIKKWEQERGHGTDLKQLAKEKQEQEDKRMATLLARTSVVADPRSEMT